MAAPSYTYSLANGTTADASQVMQNFNDILNGVSDGTKDLSINALTCAGNVSLNGNTTLGNSSADDLTVTASLASSIAIKTTNSYNIGSSTLGLASIYLGANSQTVRILPSASMSATWTLTLPTTAGTNNYILTTNGSGTTSWTSWTNSAWFADGSNAGTLSAASQTIGGAKTFSGAAVFQSTVAVSGAITMGDNATPVQHTVNGGFTFQAKSVAAGDNVDIGNATFIKVTSGSNMSGMTGGSDGRVAIIMNKTGGTLNLLNNTTSTSGNRFLSTTGSVALGSSGIAWCVYDGTSNFWFLVMDA